MGRWETLLVLAVGLSFSVATLRESVRLNLFVHWRNIGLLQPTAALLGPLLAIGWAIWRVERAPHAKWLPLGLLAGSNFLLQVIGMGIDPRGLGLIGQIIRSPLATSYFGNALDIDGMSIWLHDFPDVILGGVHAGQHPAGPVIFCWIFIKLFGTSTAAPLCGYALGLAGAAGVLVIYKFAGLWTADPKARLLASALYALMPALVVFFPEFDQIYPILSMLAIMLWSRTLTPTGTKFSPESAVFLGGVLFVAAFFAYQTLCIGVFPAFYGLHWLGREGWRLAAARKLLFAAGVVSAAFAGAYAALWAVTGYNAPRALFRGMRLARAINAQIAELAYGSYFVFNFYNFAMGLGAMVATIFVLHAVRPLNWSRRDREDTPLTLITIASLPAIDMTGLFNGETDRGWLFLVPLVTVPAAIELARLSPRWRMLLFATQGWILVCMRAKISFIEP